MHRYALALESEKEKWHLLDKDTAEHVKACSELAVLQGIADFEKSCVVHGGLNGWYDETWKASDHAMAMRSLRLHRGEDYFEPTKRGSMLVFGIKWDVYTEEGASNPILPQETEIPDDIPADKAAAYLTQKSGYRVIDCKVCRFR